MNCHVRGPFGKTASPESEQALLSSRVQNEREMRLMDNAGRSLPASAPGVPAVAPRRQIYTGSERCNDGNGCREALKPAAFETVGITSSESSAKSSRSICYLDASVKCSMLLLDGVRPFGPAMITWQSPGFAMRGHRAARPSAIVGRQWTAHMPSVCQLPDSHRLSAPRLTH